jgi:hypothetical protein
VDDRRELGYGRILWDINYLHEAMKLSGEGRSRKDFQRHVQSSVLSIGA